MAYRAALDFPLSLAFGISIKDREFSLLARSQFLANPPVRQLLPNWDLEPVLQLLTSRTYDYGSANRDKILNKALFIIALATGNRVSELAAFYQPGIVFQRNDQEIIIPVCPGFLFKNPGLNRAPPNVVLSALQEDGISHALCTIRALCYALTLPCPGVTPSAVFTSNSGASLSTANISLRLCRVIDEALPGCLPRAHDVRKMATWLAWTLGVSPREVVNRAFWSSYNIFIERYLVNNHNQSIPCVALGSS